MDNLWISEVNNVDKVKIVWDFVSTREFLVGLVAGFALGALHHYFGL